MLTRLLALPLLVVLGGIGALAMLIPAFHAFALRDWFEARMFFYSGVLFLMLAALIGIATSNDRPRQVARGQLLALLGAFTVLPVMLAVPYYEAGGARVFLDAYFEMVSSLTTTGATLVDTPSGIAPTLHLWRALVGWLGGLLIWVTAIAILEPMNLGGFEVTARGGVAGGAVRFTQITRIADPSERLIRHAERFVPIYVGLTLVLWVALIIAGDAPFVAICHAMSVLATSGISPVGGVSGAASGIAGELLIFVFLIFAMSRHTFHDRVQRGEDMPLWSDPEIRIGLFCLVAIPLFLFLRHWVGAYEGERVDNLGAAMRALWGAIFTVQSFLTTTGFVSEEWATARVWSGLGSPGLILVGLALVGGGVATTAGGIKLLRVYALYRHGRRELERLVQPSSVGGRRGRRQHIRRAGAYIAWVFFMLFGMSVALVMVLLALTGVGFESAFVLAIAALSTTGPLATVAAEMPLSYAALEPAAKLILAGAMVLGRLETLAIIALFNPDFWRP